MRVYFEAIRAVRWVEMKELIIDLGIQDGICHFRCEPVKQEERKKGETIVLFIFVLLIGFVSLCEIARSIIKLDNIYSNTLQ